VTISAAAIISDEVNREMKKISAETGKRLSFLYREAIEEYADKHKVITVEQSK
jgi:predicted DNA-binding protein